MADEKTKSIMYRINLHKISKDNNCSLTQWRGRDHDNNDSTHSKPKSIGKPKIECYTFHIYDYYKSECWTNLNNYSGRQSNFVVKEEKKLITDLPNEWVGKWENSIEFIAFRYWMQQSHMGEQINLLYSRWAIPRFSKV